MLIELKIEIEGLIKVLCDNQSTIAIEKNPMHHDRTKHVEIDKQFICEKIETKVVNLKHFPSQQQAIDILTKALHRPNFYELNLKLGMSSIYHPACEGV